jgi:hypothetical protein
MENTEFNGCITDFVVLHNQQAFEFQTILMFLMTVMSGWVTTNDPCWVISPIALALGYLSG